MRYILFLFFFSGALKVTSQTSLLETDFQKGIPSSYSIVDNDGLNPDPSVSQFSAAWVALVDPENLKDTVASSTSFFSPVGKADKWLITPPLSLGSYGNFLEWQAKSQDASFPDDYLVLISNTDAKLSSFKDTVGYILDENADWTKRTVDLSKEGYNNQTIYVAFRLITNNGYILYLDDVNCWKEDPLGLKEIYSKDEISCYPNPASDLLKINSVSPIVSCILQTMDGSIVSTSKQQHLAVGHLSDGVYFVTVITETSQKTLRFVKD